MASEGPNNPGTMADDSSVGTLTWTNVDNAKVSDDSYSEINFVSSADMFDNEVKIVKSDGSIGSINKDSGAAWSGTEAYFSYGGSSDLWGESWSVSDINDVDFGVVLSVKQNSTPSHYLKATNFGFSIPEGSQINGILVEIERKHFINVRARVDHIRITVYYTEALSEGPNNPSIAENQNVGRVDWVNVDNIKTSNNVYSTVTLNNEGADRLRARDFGFSIPLNATIDGILCEVEGKVASGSMTIDTEVFRSAASFGKQDVTFTTTEGYKSFGGESDPIDASFTPEVINGSSFGCNILIDTGNTGTVSVDHMRITIFYTEASGGSIQGISQITGVQSITI